MNLPDALLSRDAIRSERGADVIGVVTTVSPLLVTYRGSTPLPANRISIYTPTVGDVVLIRVAEGRLVVLGKLV